MKKLIVPAIMLFGLVIWGCEKDNPGDMYPDFNEEPGLKTAFADEIEPQTGSISGKVFFAGCEIPVPGAKITVSEESVNCCEEGLFCLENVPLGTHELVASKDEFDLYSQDVTIQDDNREIVVYMTSRQHSANVVGKLTGDYTGNPMSGLIVKILNPDGSESKLTAISGFDGVFQLPPVPHGDRQIVVKSSDEVIFQGELTLQDTEFELNLEVEETFEFMDNRDGRSYEAIRIGNQTWMEENLAYRHYPQETGGGNIDFPEDDVIGPEGLGFEEAASKRDTRKYGQLYTWAEAKKACPAGWHLPSDEEWKTLEKNLGMSTMEADSRGRRESDAEGTKVKSAEEWYQGGNGNNHSGFNVLPAGMNNGYGKDVRIGSYAYFWTSTSANASKAIYREMSYSKSGINRLYYGKNAGFSVRCVKDVDKIKDSVGAVIK